MVTPQLLHSHLAAGGGLQWQRAAVPPRANSFWRVLLEEVDPKYACLATVLCWVPETSYVAICRRRVCHCSTPSRELSVRRLRVHDAPIRRHSRVLARDKDHS